MEYEEKTLAAFGIVKETSPKKAEHKFIPKVRIVRCKDCASKELQYIETSCIYNKDTTKAGDGPPLLYCNACGWVFRIQV